MGTSLGVYPLEADKTIRTRSPRCLILPEHKHSASTKKLPKLDLQNLPSNGHTPAWRKGIATTRRNQDDYRWILKGSPRRPAGEPVDHWKLSIKPLRDFETFPDEWLSNMKELKSRVSQLRSDIHSVFRQHTSNNNNN